MLFLRCLRGTASVTLEVFVTHMSKKEKKEKNMNYMQSQTCKKTIVLHDQDFGQINFTKKKRVNWQDIFQQIGYLIEH